MLDRVKRKACEASTSRSEASAVNPGIVMMTVPSLIRSSHTCGPPHLNHSPLAFPVEDDPPESWVARRDVRCAATSEAAFAVARRTVAVGNAIRHIEAAPDAADGEANPPEAAIAEAELRRHDPGTHLSLIQRSVIVRAWAAERRFRGKSWHGHCDLPLPKWRMRDDWASRRAGTSCGKPNGTLAVHADNPTVIARRNRPHRLQSSRQRRH